MANKKAWWSQSSSSSLSAYRAKLSLDVLMSLNKLYNTHTHTNKHECECTKESSKAYNPKRVEP